jgi:hypothetical protein
MWLWRAGKVASEVERGVQETWQSRYRVQTLSMGGEVVSGCSQTNNQLLKRSHWAVTIKQITRPLVRGTANYLILVIVNSST